MKLALVRSVVLAATLLCLRAQADPILFLHPASQAAQPQSLVMIDLMIANLKDEDPAEVLGGFDVTLLFDPGFLSLASAEFDMFLGSPSDTIELVEPGAMSVRLFSLSLLEVSDQACIFCTGPFLSDLQGDTFRLARLGFTWHGPAPGSTSISFASATLAGGFGANLPIAALAPARIEIPEPGTPALLGLGLLLMGARSRRRLQAALARAKGGRP